MSDLSFWLFFCSSYCYDFLNFWISYLFRPTRLSYYCSKLCNVWDKSTFQIRQNYPAPVEFSPEPDFCRIWKKCRIPAPRYSPIYNKWSWQTAGHKSLRITHVNLTGISSSLFFLAYWLILPQLLWFLMSFHISAGTLALCMQHSHTVDENWEKPTIATAKILCKLHTQLKIKSYPVNSKNDQNSLTRILTSCLLFIQLIEKL